jgi:hypothetical protein
MAADPKRNALLIPGRKPSKRPFSTKEWDLGKGSCIFDRFGPVLTNKGMFLHKNWRRKAQWQYLEK